MPTVSNPSEVAAVYGGRVISPGSSEFYPVLPYSLPVFLCLGPLPTPVVVQSPPATPAPLVVLAPAPAPAMERASEPTPATVTPRRKLPAAKASPKAKTRTRRKRRTRPSAPKE